MSWARRSFRRYFVDKDPTFWAAAGAMLALSAWLYTRALSTNFIFDEQEALLANPYVNAAQDLGFFDAVRRDFWGLAPDRSIGSYRPVPNMVWRLLASGIQGAHQIIAHIAPLSEAPRLHPWVFHWLNVALHALNGAIFVKLVFFVSRRRLLAWLSGALFVSCAVLTEAVAGVVGIADVLGGLGALLGLAALGLPLWAMPLGVLGAVLFGLFSKESALVCVPLLPLAALFFAPRTHPARPRRILRALVCAGASMSAFILYVTLRKHWFPAPIPAELTEALPIDASLPSRAMHVFLRWYGQPSLPRDPMNNPLILADFPHRVAGALRVYARGLGQVLFPFRLSGDYSFPQEPIPERLVFFESVVGGALLTLPPFVAIGLWLRSLVHEYRQKRDGSLSSNISSSLPSWQTSLSPIVALALLWVVISYFPHSNIPTLLPTVRAERFWYFPALGTSALLATGFVWLFERTQRLRSGAPALVAFALFFSVQCAMARTHALDYADDLSFWTATRKAVPRSAKAHLNYSVMWGARGRLDVRLDANRTALALAPDWPMANVYMGDTLCRLARPDEAWPHYLHGFRLAPNDPNLVALGLQCLWDMKAVEAREGELRQLVGEYPGSWLAYLANDIVQNGKEHDGVAAQYRPRGYNEGPKE